MTCFLVDDQLMINAKIQAAIELVGGPAVLALWVAVATSCGASNTEGVIAHGLVAGMARSLIILPPDLEACVKALVEVRLWHDEKGLRRCEPCREHLDDNDIARLPKGGYLFHDWGKQQFNKKEAKDAPSRSSKKRKQQLHRMPKLIEAIRARDGEYCRYCAVKVNFHARTGAEAGTYDHLYPDVYEPDGGNFLDGVVVACAGCNGDKGHRTPEEWVKDGGLLLRPEPDRRSGTPNPPVRSGSGPGQDEVEASPGLTGAPARMVPGQDGSGPVLTPGAGEHGTGSGLPGPIQLSEAFKPPQPAAPNEAA